MKPYPIDELIKLWACEEITADQAIGQLLLHIQRLEREIRNLTVGQQAHSLAIRRSREGG